MEQAVRNIYLENDGLFIIDQRLLPREEKTIRLRNREDVFNAIRGLAVRGAPAIGIAAAYGVFVDAKNAVEEGLNGAAFSDRLAETAGYLASSRPTAVNLFHALDRMKKTAALKLPAGEITAKLRQEALSLHREDLEMSRMIGEHGLELVPDNARILTHCNAGALATGGGGTALAVVFRAQAAGKKVFVYADETRPLLQGSRLTAWELARTGVNHSVIADNMAGWLMKKGKVDLVIVGADRIARNGDFANKIGTYSLAVLAKHHGIPFYTAAPVSTFDFGAADGDAIPVEERDADEVLGFAGVRTAPEGSGAWNPSFDVTPHGLLTAIITEYGVVKPPFDGGIKEIGRMAGSI